MDYSTIRLIRRRVRKDLESFISEDFYKWNDRSNERTADIDLSIGFSLYARDDTDQPFLSPRQRAASEVLMLIGRYRLGCRGAPSVENGAKALDAKLTDFKVVVERYLQHVEPQEASPIRLALEGTLTRSAKTTGNVTLALPQLRAQELRIQELISELGHKPGHLPVSKKGVRGIKADIRALALRESSMFTQSTFNKAWQRLRDDDTLVDDE